MKYDSVPSEGDVLHGFRVTRVTGLPFREAVAVQAVHLTSGAGLLHVCTDDRENYFAAAFRTPPPDSTGLPHILEHAVLSGSARYPLKDPFVELLKTSMVTFLNAFTYPDRTVYPCASRNRTDFRNLMEVYCDAVWRPRLNRFSFMQEGHHLEFARPGDTGSPLVVSGIVYNEMKGAYSDPESVIEDSLTRALFPDSVYGLDSGGDPDCIPDLTYERFLEFHRRFYHPSNCRIFLYGDIPTREHMEFLDREHLGSHETGSADTAIGLQPRWDAPASDSIPLPASGDDGDTGRYAGVTGWLTCDTGDPGRVLALRLLADYLVGNDSSPLRKALVESGLGMGLVCTGFDSHRMETIFSAGLRGTGKDGADRVPGLVMEVLGRQAEEGLDRGALEASLHRIELSSMEVGRLWPFNLMNRVLRSWTYDGDPLQWLHTAEHLADLRKNIDRTPGYMEDLLREELLHNMHRVDLTFYPDPGYFARKDAELAERLRGLKDGMSRAELEETASGVSALAEYQSRPDPPEALALLPVLGLCDVPPGLEELPTSLSNPSGVPLLLTDVFANDLSYVEISLGIEGLEPELLPLVPLYCDAVLGMGAAGSGWEDMALREASCCAGIVASPSAYCTSTDASAAHPVMRFGSRCLERNLPDMLSVIADRILDCDFTDRDRLDDMVKEEAAEAESNVIARGTRYALLTATGKISGSACLRERFEGISSLRLFTGLAGRGPAPDVVISGLRRISEFVLDRMDLACSAICSPEAVGTVEGFLARLSARRRETEAGTEGMGFMAEPGSSTGVALPVSVSYTGFAVPGVPFCHPSAPALRFLARQLGYGYLWDEIRVRRGAYGAQATFGTSTGTFSLGSYRDPCVPETLETFRRLPAWVLEEMNLGREAVESGIVSVVKDLDPPGRPGSAVRTALDMHLSGTTHGRLATHREGLLSLSGDDVRRAVTDVLEPSWDTASVCVISSRETLGGLPGLVTGDLTP